MEPSEMDQDIPIVDNESSDFFCRDEREMVNDGGKESRGRGRAGGGVGKQGAEVAGS